MLFFLFFIVGCKEKPITSIPIDSVEKYYFPNLNDNYWETKSDKRANLLKELGI